MNSVKSCLSVACNILSRTNVPIATSVRLRHHADKLAKGPVLRRFGYEDKLFKGGLLPHVVHGKKVPMPEYRPKDHWNERRALFGQNDYIDILGPSNLQPIQLQYYIPSWLRGAKGSEYHMLLRKRKVFAQTMFPKYRPSKWKDLNKRIKYLYRFLNQKTKTGHSRQ